LEQSFGNDGLTRLELARRFTLDWMALDWVALDWMALDWVALDWMALDWRDPAPSPKLILSRHDGRVATPPKLG
jgi:hypothetical protein